MDINSEFEGAMMHNDLEAIRECYNKLKSLEKKHYDYAIDANKRLGEARGKLNKIRSMAERYNNTWPEDMREGTISAKIIEVCDS